jgi:hypothetical protein
MIIDFDCHLMVEINFRFPTNNDKLMLQSIVTKKSLSLNPFHYKNRSLFWVSTTITTSGLICKMTKKKLDFNCIKIYLCDNNNELNQHVSLDNVDTMMHKNLTCHINFDNHVCDWSFWSMSMLYKFLLLDLNSDNFGTPKWHKCSTNRIPLKVWFKPNI